MDVEITIDASKGFISVKGEKSFVEEIVEKYKAVFENVKAAIVPPIGDQGVNNTSSPATNISQELNGGGPLESLSNVFDMNGEEISIIADIPGTTLAAQAKNLALLYLFAKLKLGVQSVENDSIRDQSKSHAIYDSTNFATQMKAQKKLVTVSGAKGSQNFTLKLTMPGRKAAEELALTLQGAT